MVWLKAVVVNVIMCEIVRVTGKMADSQAVPPDSGPVSVSEAEEMRLQIPCWANEFTSVSLSLISRLKKPTCHECYAC